MKRLYIIPFQNSLRVVAHTLRGRVYTYPTMGYSALRQAVWA